MSKEEKLLESFKEKCGEWVCSDHNCESTQPAGVFRNIKRRGYKFEETTPGRWAKMMFCPVCGRNTTHYKLLSKEPVEQEHKRFSITSKMRQRVLKLLGERDAFTTGKITSTAEIDHKVPWSRIDNDVNISELSDDEIPKNFQLLTREHNLLKDRACSKCKKTNVRPPFLGIDYWYDGDENYTGICEGCGWYDGNKWRKYINKTLEEYGKG